MNTVQVVGIAIAVVILIVLVISLVVTRRKDAGAEDTRRPQPPTPAEDSGSFIDQAPRDDLHMLGKRDVLPPGVAALEADWQPAVAAAVAEAAAQAEPAAAETPEETTAEIPPEQPTESPAAPQTFEAAAETAPPVEPSAGSAAAAEEEAAAAPARMVRLSDIIVTTNQQQVDLADSEVRRMLKDLMQDEIDLAAQYRELGQNNDAVLQLTEAQSICNALDMTSHAKLIQQMIKELQD
jgi:hypothetical protein